MITRLASFLLIFIFSGCSSPDNSVNYIDLGQLNTMDLAEVSGVAASRMNKDILWAHNDSGDESRIFALTGQAELFATVTINNAEARDWEDIAIGPGPDEGSDYIYIGDIGDNDALYSTKYIYRLPEPDLNRGIPQKIDNVESIRFRYPDGVRDAEALFVDPLTGDIFIITKREENVHLYTLPYPQSTVQELVATFVGTLPLYKVTAADISRDGRHILIKTYKKVAYWLRQPDQSIDDALAAPPQYLPYQEEPQGEAITWAADGSGYFTLSEASDSEEQHLYYYPFEQ